MTNSTNLALPFILSSQAQKHITHNEALLALDAVVQLSVISKSQNEGALDASEGTRYIVPEDASGNFANQSGKIAAFQDGVYQFYTPQIGWLAYISDIGNYQFFDGLTWQDLPGLGTEAAFLTLGVNASADLINRFSISSDASLFNNDGNTSLRSTRHKPLIQLVFYFKRVFQAAQNLVLPAMINFGSKLAMMV